MTPLHTLSARWARLRVRTQLTLAFVTVLGLTATLGAASYAALGLVSQSSKDLAVKWMPAASHMATARIAMLETREYEVKAAHAADASYLAEYEDKLKASKAAVDKQLATYEALSHEVGEHDLDAALSKTWAAYLAINTKVVDLAKQGKMDDARDIGEGAGKMSHDDAIAALDKLTTYLFEQGQATAKHADGVHRQASLGLGALVGFSLLLGTFLAVAIGRSLIGQLGGEPADATRVARAVAGGDLSSNIQVRAGDTHSLMANLAHMQRSLADVVSAVRVGSDHVATASAEIAQGNNDLSQRTELQASALQQTAASMDELGATVSQNTQNAQQADTLARSASDVAQRGGAAVAQVVNTMRDINHSSKKIADITGVIDGIAFQTNILALNAAVEAARAGEQGRGFAVVAGEVRILAQRSAEAAREIKSLIAASVERVDAGTRQVDEAGTTMTEVVASIQRVTHIMSEISTASAEQSAGVQQVGLAVTQMDQGTAQNAALVEQSAAAAESLRQQAQQLVQAVAVFRL
ncbi:MAG: hypothetical protein RJA98_243 [Pseudomonadota bacterium]|jgi:methyl-accepting chemotaxis protein